MPEKQVEPRLPISIKPKEINEEKKKKKKSNKPASHSNCNEAPCLNETFVESI
jgi:hypothetical protein